MSTFRDKYNNRVIFVLKKKKNRLPLVDYIRCNRIVFLRSLFFHFAYFSTTWTVHNFAPTLTHLAFKILNTARAPHLLIRSTSTTYHVPRRGMYSLYFINTNRPPPGIVMNIVSLLVSIRTTISRRMIFENETHRRACSSLVTVDEGGGGRNKIYK